MTRRPSGYAAARVDEIPPDKLGQMRALQETKRWPLVLHGPVGTGKTSAAACLYGAFNRLPLWHRADDLLLSMALGRSGGVEVDSVDEYGELRRKTLPYNRFVERVRSASCLFLDDLGTRPPTESMFAALFDLLEYRLGRPLVITTNLTGKELAAAYDNRIVDRLRVGTAIKFDGVSRRRALT